MEGEKGNILVSPSIHQTFLSPLTFLKATKSDDFGKKTLIKFHKGIHQSSP